MIMQFRAFLDEWNRILGFKTPAHHYQIMDFLVGVFTTSPRRGLLMAFRHSGKSTVVGIFAACVLYLYPQTRILILSAESSLATRMVGHIVIYWKIIPGVQIWFRQIKKSGQRGA